MTYAEILENARKHMNGNCKVCKVCNGEACRGIIPGPGGKASGDGFVRAFKKLQQVKVHMDTIYEGGPIDTSCSFFGKTFAFPFFAAPIMGTFFQYGEKYNTHEYNRAVINGCKDAGTLAFTFFDPNDDKTLDEIINADCWGIPTVKPWPVEVMLRQFKEAEEKGLFAVCTDVDGAGLSLVQGMNNPVGPKSVKELTYLISNVKIPVLIKGIMTVAGAQKAVDAGAYGIVISTHGGRVQDQTPAPIEMLQDIANAVKGKIKIFIDGSIRSGIDVYKCIALGADAVLIGRPYVTTVYGADREGAEFYTKMLGTQLRETMMMTGAKNIGEITKDKVFIDKLF
jgi:isopentenyl diphosphate isomerase/L-lactate dehydrogenase-like FMN-dependent dehydrogenase